VLVGHDAAADERQLSFKPYSAYCLMNRTPCAATNTAQTASAFRLICVRYGAKSSTLSGTQIFLDHASALVLEHALKAPDLLVAERVVHRDP